MERMSERIWAAAKAHVAHRRSVLQKALGDAATALTWEETPHRHDIEYDAMVAALDVWVDTPKVGDIFTDAEGRTWRCTSVVHEPTVVMKCVASEDWEDDQGPNVWCEGDVKQAPWREGLWEGFKHDRRRSGRHLGEQEG
jgi:hypothetical protein